VIEGSLRDVALVDVLQVVLAGRKDGVLRVERAGRQARVWLSDGRLWAASVDGGVHLGEVLVRLDLLDVDEVQVLLAEQGATDDHTALGAAAVARGWIDGDQLAEAVERHLVEVIGEVAGWRDGRFRFAEGDPPPGAPTESGFDPMRVLMQVDHARSGAASVEPYAVLRRVGDPTAVPLEPEAWEVLGLIDGRRSARALAAEVDLAEGRTFGLLAELVAAGVLALAPDAAPAHPVLVVVGDDAERRLLRLALLRHGMRPHLVADLEAAAAAFEALRPSAVIVDAGLAPRAWLRTLRRRAEGSHVPVLVLGTERGPWWARGHAPGTDRLARPYREVDLQGWLDQRLPRAGP